MDRAVAGLQRLRQANVMPAGLVLNRFEAREQGYNRQYAQPEYGVIRAETRLRQHACLTVQCRNRSESCTLAETIKGGIATYPEPRWFRNSTCGRFPEPRLTSGCWCRRLIWPICQQSAPSSGFHSNEAGVGRWRLWRFALAARRAVKQFQPDIVFLHSTFAGVLTRIQIPIGKLAPKTVYCAHGCGF